MNNKELEERTMRFALKIIEFAATLPRTRVGTIVEGQIVKSGTSVGANYREASRAESRADFIHKIGIVEKESAESRYWIELCGRAGLGDKNLLKWLFQESTELLKIFVSSGRTARVNRRNQRNRLSPNTKV
jgi:four helix bundle protein